MKIQGHSQVLSPRINTGHGTRLLLVDQGTTGLQRFQAIHHHTWYFFQGSGYAQVACVTEDIGHINRHFTTLTKTGLRCRIARQWKRGLTSSAPTRGKSDILWLKKQKKPCSNKKTCRCKSALFMILNIFSVHILSPPVPANTHVHGDVWCPKVPLMRVQLVEVLTTVFSHFQGTASSPSKTGCRGLEIIQGKTVCSLWSKLLLQLKVSLGCYSISPYNSVLGSLFFILSFPLLSARPEDTAPQDVIHGRWPLSSSSCKDMKRHNFDTSALKETYLFSHL